MKKIWKLLLTLLVISMTLTACGGASKDSAAVMTTAAASAMPGSAHNKSEIAETVAATYAYVEEIGVAGTTTDSGGGLHASTAIQPAVDLGRKLIRTIHLDVETDDFDALLTKLQEQITAMAGYVEQSDVSGNSMQYSHSRRRAYMTVRIPSTRLDEFVFSVEENGNVTNKSETTTDVTLQYSDLESRKKSLTIEQERIWALLEKADTLESVIALEERLSEIRYELESMESKLRLYDNQVEYSTVYVNIEEVKIYTPTAPETVGERIQKGLARNIDNMKENVIDLFVWFVTSLPMLLPLFLILVVVILVIKRNLSKKNIKHIASSIAAKHETSDQNADQK